MDEVSIGSKLCLSLKTLFRPDRLMGGCQREIEEKGIIFCGPSIDIIYGLISELVQHQAGIEIRSPGSLPEELGKWQTGLFLCNRLGGFVVVVIGIGDHVQRSGDNKGLIESDIFGTVLERFVKVHFARLIPSPLQSDMPFSETCGVIVALLEHAGDREAFRTDQGFIVGRIEHTGLELCSPTVPACQETITSRAANGRSGVGIRETDSF
jgi:hypothetical protein